jgi:lactate dehydrogenase-like 2-hydroxyacid dehydrogenase
VGFTPDVLTDAVADLTVLLALLAMRRGKEAMQLVHSGGWPSAGWAPYMLAGPSLSASTTLGFLGFGRIAQSVLSRLLPFGPKRALYHTRSKKDDAALSKELGCEVKWVDQEELAKEADVLFVLCPGGEETKGLVGEEWLGRMKKNSVVVNTARVSTRSLLGSDSRYDRKLSDALLSSLASVGFRRRLVRPR